MRFFYRILSGLLLVMMVAVIAAFSFWKLSPGKLNKTGHAIISNYVEEGENRSARALEDLSQGDTSYAEKTLKDWSDIGNDDRYYKHKRKILLALSGYLLERGDYRKSVDFILPSIRENDRDILLFIEWAKAALNISELEEVAQAELKVMAGRFPEHVGLKKIYIQDVLYKDDEAGGLRALSELKGLSPKVGGWSVLWTIGTEAKFDKRVWIKLAPDGKRWYLQFSAPKAASTFRVDPPPYVRMELSDIKVVSGEESTRYKISEAVDINMMRASENFMAAEGENNPYFTITTPEWLPVSASEGAVDVKIELVISNVGIDAGPR